MKFFRFLLVVVIAFAVAFFIINAADFGDDNTYDLSVSDTSVQTEGNPTVAYYDQLTDFQKSIYDAILEPIGNAEKNITLTSVDIDKFDTECLTVTTALQYDHPEYFWFTGGYSYKATQSLINESGEISFEPMYYSYASGIFDAKDKFQRLKNAVTDVATLARQHSSDAYERIIFVHDYLIKNAQYDHDALDEYSNTWHSPSCEYIFSAYGCLVNKKTVCSGYAKAFQLIMQELGYDCSYVTGYAGESHGWNCVYINGEGYYIDVTWDDLDLEDETPLYDYALITEDALTKTHTVDMPFVAPDCTETLYNFFRREGYYTDRYYFPTTMAILSLQKDNSAAYIQFGSAEELKNAYTDIIENDNLQNIPGINNFSLYSVNEEHYTITFFR